jgi:hypothetical protein
MRRNKKENIMNSQTENAIAAETTDVVTTKERPLLFLAAYFIAAVIATGLYVYRNPDFVTVLVSFIVVLLHLPWGLVMAINWLLNALGIEFAIEMEELISFFGLLSRPDNASASILIGISYLVHFMIALAGSLTKKQRTFQVLFLTFIVMLLINIGGCSSQFWN